LYIPGDQGCSVNTAIPFRSLVLVCSLRIPPATQESEAPITPRHISLHKLAPRGTTAELLAKIPTINAAMFTLLLPGSRLGAPIVTSSSRPEVLLEGQRGGDSR
jgi:hypothetical protein